MKKYLILVLIVLLIGALTATVLANKKLEAGKSNIAHLYLYEKDDEWVIVDDGAWGKMKYNQSGETFDFVFNGHGLVYETEYTLIYYPDPWDGSGLICLGSGTVNEEGDIHIAESVEIEFLPIEGDENAPGAKIWLVLTSDVDCGDLDNLGYMTGWSPDDYLFEYELITFNAPSE